MAQCKRYKWAVIETIERHLANWYSAINRYRENSDRKHNRRIIYIWCSNTCSKGLTFMRIVVGSLLFLFQFRPQFASKTPVALRHWHRQLNRLCRKRMFSLLCVRYIDIMRIEKYHLLITISTRHLTSNDTHCKQSKRSDKRFSDN